MNHTRLSPEKPAIVSSPRAWLDAFPPHKRRSIVNLFHYAVRAGATTPEATRMKVWQEVRQRLTSERDTDTASHLRSVLAALVHQREAALQYAVSVIAYEQLPYPERQKVKAERSFAAIKEYMRGKPPTTPQLAYLKVLGYQGDPPTDRTAASQLIDHLRHERGLA